MVVRYSRLAPEHQAPAVDRLVKARKGHQIGHRGLCGESDQRRKIASN